MFIDVVEIVLPAARRDMQAGRHAIIETGVLFLLRLLAEFVYYL